ncbi:MAG: hypothetical protein ACKVQS_01090 [Fimbriimonadaceae bacterium]
MRRSKPLMQPIRIVLILVSALWFGGCAPAPKRVFVDLSLIPADSKTVVVSLSSPGAGSRRLSLKGQLGGRPARLLEEQAGLALWEEAKRTLNNNRERSFERLKRDLERKYIGESRAKALDAERANELLDEADWRLVLDQSQEIMERYAGKKTALDAELAGLIGFPDKGQPVPRHPREEVFIEQRKAKATRLRKDINEVDSAFKAELGVLLAQYEKGRSDRIMSLIERDYAGDLEAIALAKKESERAIQQVIGQVNYAIPQLRRQLGVLAPVTMNGESAAAVEPRFAPEGYRLGLSKQELEKYVNVFVKSRGYALGKVRDSENVTEEFAKWLKKNAVTR